MNEEEKDRLREAKREVTGWLAAVDIGRWRLGEVDARIEEYVREVAGNPAGHNLFEQLAVRRFLQLAERYGVNVREVRRFFTLYEHLHFPGKGGMRTYRLTPVQAFQFASIYGFWTGDVRVVKEAVLYVPRKFSKTTSTASFAVYDLLYV